MRRRGTKKPPGAEDFDAAAERLGEIGRGMGGLAQGLGGLLEMVESLSRAAHERSGPKEPDDHDPAAGFSREGTIELGEDGTTAIFGIKVKMGLGGMEARPFGNVAKGDDGPIVETAREPIVDVLEEDGLTVLVVELPGATLEEIEIEASDRTLRLNTTGARQYATRIDLARTIDPASLERQLTNGILEIRLKPLRSEA